MQELNGALTKNKAISTCICKRAQKSELRVCAYIEPHYHKTRNGMRMLDLTSMLPCKNKKSLKKACIPVKPVPMAHTGSYAIVILDISSLLTPARPLESCRKHALHHHILQTLTA